MDTEDSHICECNTGFTLLSDGLNCNGMYCTAPNKLAIYYYVHVIRILFDSKVHILLMQTSMSVQVATEDVLRSVLTRMVVVYAHVRMGISLHQMPEVV